MEASARAVASIVANGEPVYGINTGFGKLASARIEPADIARLQTTSCCRTRAGVGEPAPAGIVRLMLAAEAGKRSPGASGVQPATMEMLQVDAGARPDPSGCPHRAPLALPAISRRWRTWRRL